MQDLEERKSELEKRIDRLDRGGKQAMFIGLGGLFIIAVWLIVPSYLYKVVASRYENGEIPSEVGTVGDMFGSINALFAGFAFLLLIWSVKQGHEAIKIQREDLKIQRDELIESRKVLKDQADAQEMMTRAIDELRTETRIAGMVSGLSTLAQVDPSGPRHKQVAELNDFMSQLNSQTQICGVRWNRENYS